MTDQHPHTDERGIVDGTTRSHLSQRQRLDHRDLRATPASDQPVARKPMGLWYGLGSAWCDYVATHPRWQSKRGRSTYRLTFRATARVLVLDSPAEVLDATRAFGAPLPWARPTSPRDRAINWATVAAAFDAVEITARARDHRERGWIDWLDLDWAVPSGCCWNPDAIASFAPTACDIPGALR